MSIKFQPELDLDLTGINKDNRVYNEPHTLHNLKNRAIVPNKGLFYSASLIIYDGAKELVEYVDYEAVEQHHPLTVKTGKEVCAGIIIKNEDVGEFVEITYQAVGGYYSTDNNAIANLYRSIRDDKRPQDWHYILNKPNEFQPTGHPHWLEDIVGFEPVIYALERIKAAISLGQTDVVISLVNKLLNRFGCDELPKILPSEKIIQYDALLYFLSRRRIISPLWVDTEECTWRYGRMGHILIDIEQLPRGTIIRWEFYKEDGKHINLPIQKGDTFNTNQVPEGIKLVKIPIYIPSPDMKEWETLYVGVVTDLPKTNGLNQEAVYFDKAALSEMLPPIEGPTDPFEPMVHRTMVVSENMLGSSQSIPSFPRLKREAPPALTTTSNFDEGVSVRRVAMASDAPEEEKKEAVVGNNTIHISYLTPPRLFDQTYSTITIRRLDNQPTESGNPEINPDGLDTAYVEVVLVKKGTKDVALEGMTSLRLTDIDGVKIKGNPEFINEVAPGVYIFHVTSTTVGLDNIHFSTEYQISERYDTLYYVKPVEKPDPGTCSLICGYPGGIKWEGEFDAVTYRIPIRSPIYTASIYDLMSNLTGPDSDDFTSPIEYGTLDDLDYILAHNSMVVIDYSELYGI